MALIIDLGLSGVGGVRLTTDAVWETVASMHVLNFPERHAVHARLRQRIPARPRTDLTFLLGSPRITAGFPTFSRRNPPSIHPRRSNSSRLQANIPRRRPGERWPSIVECCRLDLGLADVKTHPDEGEPTDA